MKAAPFSGSSRVGGGNKVGVGVAVGVFVGGIGVEVQVGVFVGVLVGGAVGVSVGVAVGSISLQTNDHTGLSFRVNLLPLSSIQTTATCHPY